MHAPSRLCLPKTSPPPYRPWTPRVPDPRLGPERHGVYSRVQLLALGMSDGALRSAVTSGRLISVARGWYATPSATPRAVRALRLGMRLTCTDALALHGLWIPVSDSRRLHVYGRRTGRSAALLPQGVQAHRPFASVWPERDPVASIPLAAEHMLRCQDPESAAVLLESAVTTGALAPQEVDRLLEGAGYRRRRMIGELSAASESGTETKVARWLRRRGHTVEQQVWVEGAGFIDAYVAGVFLEIDGEEHHAGSEAFARDRQRDLALCRLGLQVVRLSYGQVWRSWDDTSSALLQMIAQVGPLGARRARAAGLGRFG